MKKHYLLPFLQATCFMLLSLLLQNCSGSLEGEEEPTETIEQEGEQGRRKRARIEIHQEEEQRLIEQRQEVSSFNIFPSEIWQEVFSYLDFDGVLVARAVNSDWNQLITGFREAGVVGVKNKPSHIIDTSAWTLKKEIDFIDDNLKELTPAIIPSFTFYYLMGEVGNLSQSFWPYLQGTNVHTLSLGLNQIRDAGAIELAKVLPATQVHTLNLYANLIGDAGAIELAKALSATRVHTLNLGGNEVRAAGAIELAKALPATRVHTLNLGGNHIGDAGAIELVKALPATRVHTLNLGGNHIGDAGASELAKALPDTRVHTLNLIDNDIGAAGASELAKALPATQMHTLNLGGNQIGAAGAIELAKALSGTQVHTLNLSGNQIGAAGALELAKALPAAQVHTVDLAWNQIGPDTQGLLKEQYPHIKWMF
jgi:hypothetical protein